MLVSTMAGLVRAIHFQFIEPSDDLLRNVVDNCTNFLKPRA